MSLIDDLENGCVYMPKRWSGDCGEFSRVDEDATDKLLWQAAERIKTLQTALERIAGCDWTTLDMDLRNIAREALE